MDKDNEPIVVECEYDVDRQTLWNAITDRDQMIQWFFEEIPEFRPEVGFETSFNVSTGEREFFHLWKIKDVSPEQKIVYDWRYRDVPGAGTVTFELQDCSAEENGTCKIRLTNEGIESFPQNVPEFSAESCMGGWNYFLKDRLKQFLNA